jgi:hypothetical protein
VRNPNPRWQAHRLLLPRWLGITARASSTLNLKPSIIAQFNDVALSEMIPTHIEEARKILAFDPDIEYTKSISEDFYLMMINIRAEGIAWR